MTIEHQQWNYAATVAFLVMVFLDGTITAALIMGMVTWQEWLAAAGWINGPALGWIGKAMGQS